MQTETLQEKPAIEIDQVNCWLLVIAASLKERMARKISLIKDFGVSWGSVSESLEVYCPQRLITQTEGYKQVHQIATLNGGEATVDSHKGRWWRKPSTELYIQINL